jgi:hypothetical protein
MQLEQKIAVKMDDGSFKLFDTKAEATEFLQRPKQTEAFKAFVGENPELITWLLDNRADIEGAFESAKIKRVTKSEKKALEKALDAVKAAEDKNFAFLVENRTAILESFRWPSVKRGSEEEQAAMVRKAVMAATEDNAELTDWIVANKTQILEAYEAGAIKREVSPQAAEGLAKWRAEQAAKREQEKAAEEAAKPAAEA